MKKRFLKFIALLLLCLSCETDRSPLSPLANRFARFEPVSTVTFPDIHIADVWGYADESTGKEYALVGHFRDAATGQRTDGISIVDVSDPFSPVVVATIKTVPGFDIKTWRHYAYSVDGNASDLGAVTDLSDPANPVEVGKFQDAHNIFISEDGYLFAEASLPPLSIYDLNANPIRPQRVWGGGVSGHDATVVGNMLYDFHGRDGLNIYDVTEKSVPRLLSVINDPTIAYYHSGWPTKDGKYLFVCDELSLDPAPDITVWDISDLGNPRRVAQYGDPNATVHNLYIVGDVAYVSYYNSGVRIFDVSNPVEFVLLAEYDTSESAMEGFRGHPLGAFGVYPFTKSGRIFVSDTENGLFIF